MAFVYPTVAVKLKLDGVNWTAVSSDWRRDSAASIKYGMNDGKPTTHIAQTGEAHFLLNNSDRNSGSLLGYYSPNNSNVRTGFKQNVPCRFELSYGGTTYYKFTGRLKEISPIPGRYGERLTACVAVDYMDDLARASLTGITTQTNKRGDQLLTTLVAAMTLQPTSTSFDTGASTFPYGMVGGTDGVINGLQECQRIAMSEFGYIYVKGDTTAGGVFRFENRHARLALTTSLSTLSETSMQQPMTVPSSTDDVINSVYATVHPRRADVSTVVLYSSLTIPTIPPGQTVTINAPYRDPSQTSSIGSARVSGTSMVAPVATTDYLANSASDGSGTNLTASLSVTATLGSTGATLVLANGSGSTMYLTKLQVRGIGLYDYDAAVAISMDATSISTYGANTTRFDMPYESNPLLGQAAADFVRIAWANPFGFAYSVSFLANASAANMTAALAREIGDRVSISEPVTGVSGDFIINGIELQIEGGPILHCKWILAPASNARSWILGAVGAGELGQTTYVGAF